MADLTVLRISLFEAFDQLLQAINTLSKAIGDDQSYPAWVSRTEDEIAAKLPVREKARYLYSALWYENEQDGRATLTCPGLVAASPATMAAAHACNAAKDDFKQAVLALKSTRKSTAAMWLEELHTRNADVALSMQRMGAARLNLKQAYRHVPLLTVRPKKIGFTWSKQGRTIQRTSVAEARRLLERRADSPQISAELNRLASVPAEEVLARVRSVCPHLRANIVFEHDDGQVERRLMQAPLPILIAQRSPRDPLPEYVPIPPEPVGARRLKRSDVRIEDDAFLPLIRIHRYKEAYRGPAAKA